MSNLNPYMARKIGKCVGRDAEKHTARRLGGSVIPGSGAVEGLKGDIKLEDFLVESKVTEAGSMSIKLNWLIKITTEALNVGKKPALAVTFVHGNSQPRKGGKYVILRERDYLELIDGS